MALNLGFKLGGGAGIGTNSSGGAVSAVRGNWHPSVVYLLLLVLAEMLVFRWIATVLR